MLLYPRLVSTILPNQLEVVKPLTVDPGETEALIDGSPKAHDPADDLEDHVDGPIEVVVAITLTQIISEVIRGYGGL